MKEWPLLIIVPSSLKNQWLQEIKKWIPEKSTRTHIIETSSDVLSRRFGDINIVSYDLLPRIKDHINEQKFNVIIADESHYLKNRKALRTRSIVPIIKNANRRILLTGTPAMSRPEELYPQLDALGCSIFSSFKKFGDRYCGAHMTPYGIDYSGSSNLSELHTILCESVMIRRMKSNVLHQLPEKKRHVIYLEPSNPILVDEIQKQLQLSGNNSENWLEG